VSTIKAHVAAECAAQSGVKVLLFQSLKRTFVAFLLALAIPVGQSALAPTTPAFGLTVGGVPIEAGANLSFQNLSNFDLSGLDLTGTNFYGATMDKVNLKGATLNEADFTNATLKSADLSESTMFRALFPLANLTGANLSNANMEQAEFGGAKLGDADLRGSVLKYLNLTGATLSNANFQDSAPNLLRCASNVKGVPINLPSRWVLRAGWLLGPNSSCEGLYAKDLAGLNLDGANLANANLVNANLTGASLIGTTLRDTNLTGATLDGVRSGKILVGPRNTLPAGWAISNGYLFGPKANLSYEILDNFDLKGLVFEDTNFEGASLRNVDLSHTNIKRANFKDADLENADLTGAEIDGADFSSSKMESVSGTAINGTPSKLPAGWGLYNDQGVTRIGKLKALTNTSIPVVLGTFKVGNVLEVVLGEWDARSVDLQWLRNGQEIPGQFYTGYELTNQDLNSEVSIRVTLSKPGYETAIIQSEAKKVLWSVLPSGPTPTISGSFKTGEKLEVLLGTWEQGITLSQQWYKGDDPIPGANKSWYLVSPDDLGSAIHVRVTGSKETYSSVSVTSESRVVTEGAISRAPAPLIAGILQAGQTITATPGDWDSGVTLTYQWFRDRVAISGAINNSLQLTAEDTGKQITVEVTGAKTGYATIKKPSTAVKIEPGAQLLTPAPTISGTTKVGQTMTATPGTWDAGVTLTYQWLRDGVSISGAASASYVLTPGDVGRNVAVGVTGTLAGYVTVAKLSTPVKVAAGSMTITTPKVTGTAKSGSTLKVTTSAWVKGSKITYQWLSNGTAIKGATSSSFKLTTAYKGKKISVKVTQTATGYTTAVKTSSSVTVSK
jgi:uncharacterized protein YjbI with pentapeptide repeats